MAPAKVDSGKAHLPCPARQIYDQFLDLESKRRLRPQGHPARHITRDKKNRADADDNNRKPSEPFNQFEIRRHPEFHQLQLQIPPLNRDC